MRGPTIEENLNVIPSDLRANTKTTQAYLDVRRKILTGELKAYQLMSKLGRTPSWCTETTDVVQSTTFERQIFGLSSDDPVPLLKILRRIFDNEGNPLLADFLTDRGDIYRFHYSFPLFTNGIPKALRDK